MSPEDADETASVHCLFALLSSSLCSLLYCLLFTQLSLSLCFTLSMLEVTA